MLEKLTKIEQFLHKMNRKIFYGTASSLFFLTLIISLFKQQSFLAGTSLLMFLFCCILFTKENMEKLINDELEIKIDDEIVEQKQEQKEKDVEETKVVKKKSSGISFDD